MPESARPDMSKEHLSIEERQVARALEEARGAKAGRDWPASVEALRNFGKVEAEKPVISPSVEAVRSVVNLADEPRPIGPDYGDPYKGIAETSADMAESLMSPEERERYAREQRAEYTKGSWAAELIRTSDNPETIAAATRMLLANIEANDEVPNIQAIDHIRNSLADRAAIYRLAATDPEQAIRMGVDKKCGIVLTETRSRLLAREVVFPGKRWRIQTNGMGGEQSALLDTLDLAFEEDEDGSIYALVKEEDALKLSETKVGRSIWNRTIEKVTPPTFTKDELDKLAKACEKASEELGIRRKVFTASILYGGSQAQLGKLCGLWVDGRYAGIGDKDWKSLLTLGELKEGEAKFGDKMEMGLRILTLIGTGGGGAKFFRVPGEFRNREDEERATRPERERTLREALRTQPGEIRNLFADERRFQELVDKAQENLFCDLPRDASAIEGVKNWVVDVVNGEKGNKADTKAAADYAWHLFFMWGIARQFDCRTANNGRFEPKGVPATDDIVKLKYFNEARAKDAAKGHPHGPDATMGQFPEGFSTINFLEYAKPKSDRSTFWKQWWEEGKHLKDLNWENGGNAWFRYNEGLMNFAGDPEGKDKGLFNALMRPVNRPSDIMNIDSFRSLVKMVDKASSVWPVDGREKNELKAKVLWLYIYGNISVTIQNIGQNTWKEWGVGMPKGMFSSADKRDVDTATERRENLERVLKLAEINIDLNDLDERVRNLSKKK